MNDFKISADRQRLSAAELRKLPPDERSAILEAQAARTEELYSNNPELTDFDAFAEVDLHDNGSSQVGMGI